MIDDRDRVADLLHLVEQVRGEEHRPALGDEAADHAAELVDAGRVEAVGRLVQDQELGVGEQCARDPEALAHPERIGRNALVRPPAEPNARERRFDAVMRLALARGGDHRQVLAAGQVAMEARLLDDRAHAGERCGPLGRNRLTEKPHRPGGRAGQPEQHPDQRRLPGAVRSEVAEGGAARDDEVDPVDGDALAKTLR